MSNKTELQSNNVDLQGILDSINALPEAGSGGGGSIETCTGVVAVMSPTVGNEVVHYTNENLEAATVALLRMGTATITVAKNTIIFISASATPISSCTGGTKLNNFAACITNDNFQINLDM